MVIGLSSSAEAYLKPSVQATRELPKPKSGFLSINAVTAQCGEKRIAPHSATAGE